MVPFIYTDFVIVLFDMVMMMVMAMGARAFDGYKLLFASCRCFEIEASRHSSIAFDLWFRLTLLGTHLGGGCLIECVIVLSRL